MNKVCTLSEAVEKYVQNGDTICFGGFTTNRKPATLEKSVLGNPLHKQINYEPYELDGTGPYLVHICASFARKGSDISKKSPPIKLNTCFALRGKLNGLHP